MRTSAMHFLLATRGTCEYHSVQRTTRAGSHEPACRETLRATAVSSILAAPQTQPNGA